MLWFARREVDLVILEVGLGGRLDATNVVTPLVSLITNVSMDHEMYLGDTLAEIAAEKAGIIKKGIPVVSGVGLGETGDERIARSVIERFSKEKGAPLYLHGRDFLMEQAEDSSWNYWAMKRKGCCQLREKITGLTSNLIGNYQMVNTGLALATLEFLDQFGFTVDESQIRSALLEVSWPGRLESFCLSKNDGSKVDCTEKNSQQYLLDGAHNPAGVASLYEALENDFHFDKLILVWAAMSDKDFSVVLPQIAQMTHKIIFTKLDYERSAEPEQLVDALESDIKERVTCESSLDSALAMAADYADENDMICIAGSLYLIGEARKRLLGEIL
jgi:dihydrofolate synthase/folylpolyglutamate synthase